ncbi:MAG: hypothetical protein U9R60_04540, partial [Bacteroidota bacterium]|nr:hypothetical protein [Bacteroidota bacterium]
MANDEFQFELIKLSLIFIDNCRKALPSLDAYDAAYHKKRKTMKPIRTKLIISTLSFALLFFALHPGVKAQKPGEKHEGKICQVSSYSMNKICKEWDGQWQGIGVASDGNCYFATSTHSSGHGAGFHVYDPVKKEHRVI